MSESKFVAKADFLWFKKKQDVPDAEVVANPHWVKEGLVVPKDFVPPPVEDVNGDGKVDSKDVAQVQAAKRKYVKRK